MKATIALAFMLVLAFTLGCETSTTPARPSANTPNNNPPAVAPNNTGVNERDRHVTAKTPIDQDEDQADVDITAEIRKRIMAREGMSLNAQNVKVITGGPGKVTLRGPVDTADEKTLIDGIARNVAGNDNVDNQLEVVPKDK